jgi:hypothetical protein
MELRVEDWRSDGSGFCKVVEFHTLRELQSRSCRVVESWNCRVVV